jgi:hypothetical protein
MDRDRKTRRRILVAFLAGTAGLAGACGSDAPSTPVEPSPPTATRAFVHVLDLEAADKPKPSCRGYVGTPVPVSTFEVTSSGELRSLATQSIDGARRLAADPLGRFLYVGGVKDIPGYVSSYAVDAASGALSRRSQFVPSTAYLGCCPPASEPSALAATKEQLFVSRTADYGYPIHPGFTVVWVEPGTGNLRQDQGPYHDFYDAPGWILPHPSLPVVYADDDKHGVIVLSPRAQDGRLAEIERVVTPGSLPGYRGRAEAAALTGECLVATWATRDPAVLGGITSYRVDPGTGQLTEAATVSGFWPMAIAGAEGRVAVATSAVVALYFVGASCAIEPRDTMPITLAPEGPSGTLAPSALAFHPSGRFLYLAEHDGLQTYAILDTQRLRLLQTLTGVRGRITVAVPPS